MNYWMHRISHQAQLSYPLLNQGYLTIGFSEFTEDAIIEKARSNNWSYFDRKFKEKWGLKPRTRHNLWRFLNFSQGDIIIVPSWGSFYVCEIEGEMPIKIGDAYNEGLKTWGDASVHKNGDLLTTEQGKVYDLGFAWKVKVLYKEISREKFADAKLTARMKVRQTNVNLNDLKTNIEASITNYAENKPIHLHSILLENTAEIVLKTIQNELNPDKFEKLVKAYFETIGANSVSIPAKNERDKKGDGDIIAVFEHLKLIVYTQVKFHKGKTNNLGAEQIIEYKANRESIDDGYNKTAWVVSTAKSFNEKAENLAKENEIQLINGIEFSKMLLNAGINLLNKNL
jgi:predicted Mrr-cat superfamily restriction endonuclease